MRLAIQIPCLNEEQTIAAVIRDIRNATENYPDVIVLVIDDGSTDGTVAAAFNAGADYVIRHTRNEGLARAYLTGLSAAVNLGADIIVNTDADNQYRASSIQRIVDPIAEGAADLVVGARPISDIEHFSPLKKTLQKLGSGVVRYLSRTSVTDATSGFRAISRQASLRLNTFSDYTYTLETLIQAGLSGLRVKSVDIETNGPTRPSRLISSMWRYVARSTHDILLIFTIYAPLRSYLIASSLPFTLGALLAVRYLVSIAFFDPSRSHAPSLIAASLLMSFAFLLWALGVIGELMSVNRRLLEEIRFSRRLAEAETGNLSARSEYKNSSSAWGPARSQAEPGSRGSRAKGSQMNEPRILQNRLFELGSSSLTKILMLQDRNPHSPTYGCFDRKFWHLRVTDFPSGMAQEFVLPLALAYAHSFPGNRFEAVPAVREWIRAGIEYAARSSHPDGSCDDYYPFEKASGAAAFSLYAALEALKLTNIDVQPFLPFLERRARWLATHEESGRLSNHEALIANCLFRFARMSGQEEFAHHARKRLSRLLAWQHPEEGWFYEYQGADPGYLTLTIANLAEIDSEWPELNIRDPLRKSIGFLHRMQPPDGWPGGEWTSRNTHNYFPHGLEICGRWLPEGLQVNDRAIRALADPPEYCDDNILAHHCWSYLKAGLDWNTKRPAPSVTRPASFPAAGIELVQQGAWTLLAATKKGGSFRLYHGERLIHADTGVSILCRRGKRTDNYVCHLWSEENRINRSGAGLTVSGIMGRAKSSQMTPLKNLILRILMLSFGRYKPDLVRAALQRLLITGRANSPFRFERRLTLTLSSLEVEDRIWGKGIIHEAGAGPAQTSIYTVMSRVYHSSQLQPWQDLSPAVQGKSGLIFHATRKIEVPQ